MPPIGATPAPARRGRAPIGERAMTAAERQQRHRDKLRLFGPPPPVCPWHGSPDGALPAALRAALVELRPVFAQQIGENAIREALAPLLRRVTEIERVLRLTAVHEHPGRATRQRPLGAAPPVQARGGL